jgi:ubiquinol-cytochrome c reductase cytochrome c1 subunit
MKSLAATFVLLALAAGAHAEDASLAPQKWSFAGLRAGWNKAELYRGYTVATQVCLSCHSFKYVTHRDLMQVGFTEAEVKALASALHMTVDQPIVSGLSEKDAQDTYGKVPPDLSLMAKAREGGLDYVYAVLTGFAPNPGEVSASFPQGLPKNTYFNRAFPGHAIAMPPPLTGPDMVSYADGTSATVPQMAHDVATFLQWTAEPERVERRRLGVFVVLYLVIFTLLAYVAKRAIWRDVH